MNKKITAQEIFTAASDHGIKPAKIAIYENFSDWFNVSFWSDPVLTDGIEPEFVTDVIGVVRDDILSRCAVDVARSVQFPPSTAYAHGMAVIATAMTKSFKYDYYGSEKKVNLYVVTSQPTGSGKSAINDYFSNPVRDQYLKINNNNKKDRNLILSKIRNLESQLKLSKNDNEIETIATDIEIQKERLEKFPLYTYAWTDITPEALEVRAFAQGGLFNLVSAEATVINSLLGNMYSDRTVNNEMLLKGWDGEMVSSARITRDGVCGESTGNVAVIAQDETIKAILHAGQRGNGICQRFLIFREPHIMGSRDFSPNSFIPTNDNIYSEYLDLIRNLCEENNVKLTISADAMNFLHGRKSRLEPMLADDGKYGNEMLRGVVAKMDKQVIKMACVFHAVKNWCRGGSKCKVIDFETMLYSYSIYDVMLKNYINSSASQGYSGKTVEIAKVKEKITSYRQKGLKSVRISRLRDDIKKNIPFKSYAKLTDHLRSDIFPDLEDQNWIVVYENDIYLSPKIY